MNQQPASSSNLSRQQRRAQSRQKRDADGWITTLGVHDPGLARTIRAALGNRHLTRGELEEAIGMSLADPSQGLQTTSSPSRAEPERITLQHILVSFAGAGTAATRTQEAAATVAAETMERVRQGEDFGELVRELSDDAYPGIYSLCNTGISPRPGEEYPRDGMVPAFGDVGFALDVGGIGVAPFDPRTSPYGWHIIKRLA